MIARFDRFISLYCIRPLRWVHTEPTVNIPILMYHSISSIEETTHPYYRINTLPSLFAEQTRFLSENGYRTIGLENLSDRGVDGKCVVITFDDGYADFYSVAFPVLQRYGFSATVFLPTYYMGVGSFNGRRTLSWPQIRELRKERITFGSHSHTHPQLLGISDEAVNDELITSKKMIEDEIGTPISFFSYPFRFPEEKGRFVDRLCHALKAAGYSHGVTTRIGRHKQADQPFLIKRLPVNSSDDFALFKAKLEGNYDWFHGIQLASKRIRSLIA